MKRAVIAGYSRSPFTMARKGELIDVKPVNMFAEVVKNLVSKTKVNSADIEDIVAVSYTHLTLPTSVTV